MFKSVNEILKCDHSNQATIHYFPVMLFVILYKVALTLESFCKILGVINQMKTAEHSTFLWCCLLCFSWMV